MKHKPVSIRLLLLASIVLMTIAPSIHAQRAPSDNSQEPPDYCGSVMIIGAVRVPSRFEFRRSVRLQELIACAGGLTEKAGKYAHILHTAQWESCRKAGDSFEPSRSTGTTDLRFPEVYSLTMAASGEEKSNPVVRAGDIIGVLEFDPIFVTGGVISPQAIPLKETLIVSKAIAMAGGVTSLAKTDKIRIVRQAFGSSTRIEMIVNLKEIRRHRAEDIELQAFDIIEVQEKPFRGNRDPAWGKVIGVSPSLPLSIDCDSSRFLTAK